MYLNYGLHDMMNAVTEEEGHPAAVLIRALEPLDGLALMRRRRSRAPWRKGKPPVPDHELCRGPGNLCRAMGITLADNLRPLTRGPLTIHDRGIAAGEIVWDSRIGIRVGTEHQWRATVKGHRVRFRTTALRGQARRSAKHASTPCQKCDADPKLSTCTLAPALLRS